MRSRIFLMFSVLCLSVSSTFAYNWSDNPGDGTETNPYQISTPEHLIAINDLNTTNVHFVMANNIDLFGQTYTSAVVAAFSGVFDGNGFKILNLTGSSLFGKIEGIDAVVKNLGIENISSNSGGGGLAGALSYGLIKNCHTTGTIQGTSYYLGGLVGHSYNNATISDCYNQCNVSRAGDSNWYIGGLVGWQGSGEIIRCYNKGTITGTHEIGGITGAQGDGEIYQCYNQGTIIGIGDSQSIGGIVGFQYEGRIKDCYNTGSIEGFSLVGGITGRGGYVQNCYNIGLITGQDGVGGLAGYDIGSINSFWNLETSGVSSTAPRYGRTLEQMKQAATYIGWNDDGPVWVLDEGNDYPRLIWEGTPGLPLLTHSLLEYLPEGIGTEWDPYRIYTAEQLDAIGLFPDEWNKVFSMENDIDAGSLTQFRRIGTGMIPFSGTFEGNGFSISNFTYITTENEHGVGLFGWTFDGIIRNLKLENVNILSNEGGVGSISGVLYLGVLDNCSSTGTVSGEDYVGGLIGASNSAITNCHSSCTVSGNIIVGGFIGNTVGTINNCYSTGDVVGNGMQNESIGGFAGQQFDGTIVACYSTGNIYGTSKLGGFVGAQSQGDYWGSESSTAKILNSYSQGNVSCDDGSTYVGGFVGYQYIEIGTGLISDCYSADNIQVGASSSHIGGFAGYQYNEEINNCYWDTDTSGLTDGVGNLDPDSEGVFGKTTVEMQTMSTFTGWDFSEMDGDPADWHPPTTDYPHLAWEPYHFGDGSGTPEDPYQIWNHQQMNAIGLNSDLWDKHFDLMTDIDMSAYTGTQYNIIGYHPSMCLALGAFTGSFDGNGHVIHNFTYMAEDYEYGTYICYLDHFGLFGYIEGGVIKNLGLENISLTNNQNFAYTVAGGLAAWNNGTISNCFVAGSISGFSSVGGLVGGNQGEIANCYVIGSFSGIDDAGGMVGNNHGSCSNCYTAVSVSIESELSNSNGGFMGWNTGALSACFWNLDLCEATGQGDLNGVTGKTTAELQTLSTFTNEGWDFVGDGDGNQDIWRMCVDGVNYPKLSWEFSDDGDFSCPDGVGLDDLAALGENWLASVETQPEIFNYACDANTDGSINLIDYSILAANWLTN